MCRRFFRSPSLSDGCQSGDGRVCYEVSDFGRVRSLPRKGGNNRWYGGKILIARPHKGYPMVPLCRNRTRTMAQVHTLVLSAFIGPPPPGYEGCHNNGQRADSTLGNLRWDTHAANMADMRLHGTSPAGERHGQAKLTWAAVKDIRSRYAAGRSGTGPRVTQDELALAYGVCRSRISYLVTGRAWAA